MRKVSSVKAGDTGRQHVKWTDGCVAEGKLGLECFPLQENIVNQRAEKVRVGHFEVCPQPRRSRVEFLSEGDLSQRELLAQSAGGALGEVIPMPEDRRRIRLSTRLRSAEDPDFFFYLGEVNGNHRSMRMKLLMRKGFEAMFSAPERSVEASSHTPVIASAAPKASSSAPRGLAALGLDPRDFQFETS